MIKNSLLFIMMEKCHWELNVLSVEKRGCLEKAVDTSRELITGWLWTLSALLVQGSAKDKFFVLNFSFSFFTAEFFTFSCTWTLEWYDTSKSGPRCNTLLTAEAHVCFPSALSDHTGQWHFERNSVPVSKTSAEHTDESHWPKKKLCPNKLERNHKTVVRREESGYLF